MMHLEAIKERNRKPAPQPTYLEGLDFNGDESRVREIMREAVSPMASIDAAPLPEYMQGR